jgi:PPOX class probable F420-dependent enzyme
VDEQEARERFASQPVVRLATVRPDGTPHVVPITFVLDGDRVHTAVDAKPKRHARLQRLANLHHQPRCALLADHYEDDWRRLWWVRADGDATVVDEPDPHDPALALLVQRYPVYRLSPPSGPLITVDVARWTGGRRRWPERGPPAGRRTVSPMAAPEVLELAGREVRITSPDKVLFPQAGHAKRDIVGYYLSVAEGALAGVAGRPMVLKRFVHGVAQKAFFQKRAPESRPDWVDTVTLAFPSGRTAEEVVVRDAAQLAWVVNLGCVDLNPHPVRADDLDHPDELRVDLDPVPGVEWAQVRDVACLAGEVLADHGLTGWPKTSGSRGLHIYARLERRWAFDEVRRAAVAVAREVERRAPELATSRWWKEERHGVFVDYNQNAKDRTVASAYSVRPTSDARVSTPLSWDEVPGCDPAAFTVDTVPARVAELGDPAAGMDAHPGSLAPLLELADEQEAGGFGDAPWPPHYEKAADEPTRAPPSRRRSRMPVIEVARAATEAEARVGLERWAARHPEAWARLDPADVLVDSMRGRSSTWTRIRLNLHRVPPEQRPPQEPLEVDAPPDGPHRRSDEGGSRRRRG